MEIIMQKKSFIWYTRYLQIWSWIINEFFNTFKKLIKQHFIYFSYEYIDSENTLSLCRQCPYIVIVQNNTI
jgi:hypothetical protein